MNPLTDKPYSKDYYKYEKIRSNLPAASDKIKKDLIFKINLNLNQKSIKFILQKEDSV